MGSRQTRHDELRQAFTNLGADLDGLEDALNADCEKIAAIEMRSGTNPEDRDAKTNATLRRMYARAGATERELRAVKDAMAAIRAEQAGDAEPGSANLTAGERSASDVMAELRGDAPAEDVKAHKPRVIDQSSDLARIEQPRRSGAKGGQPLTSDDSITDWQGANA